MLTKTLTSGPHAEPAGLQPLARRFKLWRAVRQRGQRIPDHLWQAATDLPVILVTALVSETDQRRGLEVGANAYISKPAFDQKVLLDALKRLI